jgi:acyl-CoA thioesterase
MGGAIFTLADFALAVACNVGEKPTMSVQSSIEYYNVARGARLIATAEADKSGRSLGFYTVDITDDVGTKVARMTATCFRRA